MKNTICNVLIAVFTVLLMVSCYFIFDHFYQENKVRNLYDGLAETVSQMKDGESLTETKQNNETEADTQFNGYADLYQQNPDMVGWITVPDTKINYPVVQTPDEPNYYLHRDFDGENAACGCPYVQENCDVNKPSDNLIIYGHNMKNGTMFGELDKFKNKDFWSEHKTLSFNTLIENRTYEIVSVFKTLADSEKPDAFPYYRFVEAENEAVFDTFIAESKKLALYDTGVDAVYGDKLLTLSTCEYSQANGRLVLVAKQVYDEKG